MDKPFKFKQFSVNQDRCAMKIGTDSVLLGAWTTIKNPYAILDIGTGTGVLALMMAQRTNAEIIDAVEIDDDAFEQCVENFEQSIWSDRLYCYHASIGEFADEIEDKYHLIISNPPYYTEDYKSKGYQRDLARFSDAMPFKHLVGCVSKLLSQDGIFSVIIPYKEESEFIQIAFDYKLFPQRILHVKGHPNSDTKRSLIEFTFSKCQLSVNELVIETNRHEYTEAYVELTKDFYLKM